MVATLEQIFNHVVLPPDIPGSADFNSLDIGFSLLDRLCEICDTLGALTDARFHDGWRVAKASLKACWKTNQEDSTTKDYREALQSLPDTEKRILICHLVEQNAVLFIRRATDADQKNVVIFEAFEASARTEEILAAPNSLVWSFPSRAVQIPAAIFEDPSFQEELSSFLSKANSEELSHLAASVSKSGASVKETRNATSPALITHMLLSLLEALGSPADVAPLDKRIRDDVNITTGMQPWRRLPFWLVLRVALLRQLTTIHGSVVGRCAYKLLMCVFLARLLHDCTKAKMDPSKVSLAQKKLCRRLAKLEHFHPKSATRACDELIRSATSICRKSVKNAAAFIEVEFSLFKNNVTRVIPRLPSKADESDMILSLPSSREYLSDLLSRRSSHSAPTSGNTTSNPILNITKSAGVLKSQEFEDTYLHASQQMEKARSFASTLWSNEPGVREAGTDVMFALSRNIEDLLKHIGSVVLDPENVSAFILTVFELWICLDAHAVATDPMLKEYAPVFKPVLLNQLQLPTLEAMKRARKIQKYLNERQTESRFQHTTIFSDLDQCCFASRYAESKSPLMTALLEKIRREQLSMRQTKEREWQAACEEYKKYSENISSLACVCSYHADGSKDIRGCVKCWSYRKRRRMQITICENLLPDDEHLAAAIVFELAIPKHLATYRTVTWKIMNELANPTKLKSEPVRQHLHDYSRLSPFVHTSLGNGVSIASSVKSFEQTHYSTKKMKVDLNEALVPLGLKFRLFDRDSDQWVSDPKKPLTLAHLCGISIPRSLKVTVLPPSTHPPTNPTGPSSYITVASRPECPSEMSVHEFEASQRLLSGCSRRWLDMLVEMGSSNLNFSKQQTAILFSHLANQIGGARSVDLNTLDPTSHDLALGEMHKVFEDDNFVRSLLGEVIARLNSINSNWREIHLMELLITLILRCLELCNVSQRDHATALLKTARETTLGWIHELRRELHSATDGDAAQRAASYAFAASLLCRRTFCILASDRYRGVDFGPDDICTFLQASIALQQNFVVDVGKLSKDVQHMLIRDIITADGLRPKIEKAIVAYPKSTVAAISYSLGFSDKIVLPSAGGNTETSWSFASLAILGDAAPGWMSAKTVPDSNAQTTFSQTIHIHYMNGHVLINGKTIGKLPADIRDAPEVKKLFGDRHLLTYPSPMEHMSHRLAAPFRQHEIHFGVHQGRVVIMAKWGRWGALLEFVPRRIFIDRLGNYDLPRRLVDDCVHWFNHRTRLVEIRREPSEWQPRSSQWQLNIQSRTAHRRGVTLVNQASGTWNLFASIFKHFEDLQQLTVFQPKRGSLSAEFKHLDLSFRVFKGTLQCPELDAEVDPNQDAGTLYGFQSMVVLRNLRDSTQRSIIVPLSQLESERNGPHVLVRAQVHKPRCDKSLTGYALFGIDTIVGRLTCQPEPVLLYTKALLHASTSLPIPDPLTGRTGQEEAVHTLLSGRCQPWSSLSWGAATVLQQFTNLAPTREFYPPEKKVLQKVYWQRSAQHGMQNDRYCRLVDNIMEKSYRLSDLDDNGSLDQEVNEPGGRNSITDSMPELKTRGELQIQRYQCLDTFDHHFAQKNSKDLLYASLGSSTFGKSSVLQVAKMLNEKHEVIPMGEDVSTILESWNLIGAFDDTMSVELSPISTFLETKTFGERFGGLVELCRKSTPKQHYLITFTLSLCAFAPNANMDAVRLLAGLSYLPKLKSLEPPGHAFFAAFKYKETLALKTVSTVVSAARRAYSNSTGVTLATDRENRKRHADLCEKDGTELAKLLWEQWPNKEEADPGDYHSNVIDVDEVLQNLQPEWTRLLQNKDLSEYISLTQSYLKPYRARCLGRQKHDKKRSVMGDRTLVPCHPGITPDVSSLIRRSAVFVQHKVTKVNPSATVSSCQDEPGVDSYHVPPHFAELKYIASLFSECGDSLRQQYGGDLSESLQALHKTNKQQQQKRLHSIKPPPSLSELDAEIRTATEASGMLFQEIKSYMVEKPDNWLEQGGLWPRLTPVTVLELLRSQSKHQYGPNVLGMLVEYGCAITEVQRLQRLRKSLCKQDSRRFLEEEANRGHQNWNPIGQPDWLLLEVDSDILIRPEQIDVALAIIAPESNCNSLLQLNMGKGKTSCIVPMAMAALANGKDLARLIVPKALILPTAQIVQSRLGGLVGRELRQIPFSRRTATGNGAAEKVALFKQHHNELLKDHGILLASPEHILAFELSGRQCVVDGKTDIAKTMTDFQNELTQTMCRDVLDESDFTLAVRTQLVYPSGELTGVDGAPHRWKLVQELLSLVEDNIHNLSHNFPRGVEVTQRPGGGFPFICILQAELEETLQQRIIQDISSGHIAFFRPTPDKSQRKRRLQRTATVEEAEEMIRKALTNLDNDDDLYKAAELFSDSGAVTNGLLLVRGLLKHKILVTCLSKRWNVKYGLHPNRWPIAVPFEAKGVPSERSEFGHPDVAIIFTCLAFYYSGLNKKQFHEGLQYVLQHTDDPAIEYERWAAGSGAPQLPAELTHWNVINVDDDGQMETLWQHLHLSRPVIDHYLNTFVFPIHARQFSVKLQASAWDLPLFNAGAAPKARTTGFSGTNDNKAMLPLNIQQKDLPNLQQTNAEVLTYLLQERNREYVCTRSNGRRWTEDELLENLARSKTRILIDAGAYILEKGNESVVTEWLAKVPSVPAAVFFGASDNRAWVKFRDASARTMPLVTTPFVDRLDECLVYFDEAHTRGVDLLLPSHSKGALTLALGQTKDHTVQAAMRLRQLGTTQSVVFYAPPEVDQSIRDLFASGQTNKSEPIESPQVITWLLEQTCRANEQLLPLYISHGYDFCKRSNALLSNPQFHTNQRQRRTVLKVLQQPERQTLAQVYGKRVVSHDTRPSNLAVNELKDFVAKLHTLQTDNDSAGGREMDQPSGAFEEVEQEREVEFQVEQIREKQQRHKYDSLKFTQVHPAIRKFTVDGVLEGGKGYEQVFAYVARTGIGERYGVRATSSRLFVSSEFKRTIEPPETIGRHPYDDFLRPVDWVLWCPPTDTALVVIPEEAEEIVVQMRRLTNAKSPIRTHLLAYASPVTRSMVKFGDLAHFALPELPDGCQPPAWLSIEVGILAGRLYMTYGQCMDMKAYLNQIIEKGGETIKDSFCADPVGFLMEWLPLRRVGQDIMHTPAAYVCQGRALQKNHPFFLNGAKHVPMALSDASHSQSSPGDSSMDSSHSDMSGEEVNTEEGLEGSSDEEDQGSDVLDKVGEDYENMTHGDGIVDELVASLGGNLGLGG